MIEIDVQLAERLVREAVEARGADYVYPDLNACEYVFGETADGRIEPLSHVDGDELKRTRPGCLVGDAVHRAGVSLDDLIGCDGDAVDLRHHLRDHEIAEVTGDATQFFLRAQRAQDYGYTWGEALQAALSGIMHDQRKLGAGV